jgi:hypothetical protein
MEIMSFNFTAAQVSAVVATLPDEEDQQLLADMLEGETNLLDFASRLLSQNEDDEGVINALAEQIEDRKTRQERAKRRVSSRRDMLMAMMDIARLDKLVLPEATVTKRSVPPKAIVSDEAVLPDEYCSFVRNPNITQIRADFGADGVMIPGVSFDNGGQSITVRRK